ncbi:PAN domain protein [Ancylostoma duodenale]|uniref:PAN domain protein n=1 Tax=Ancylostoma duodenale TaxID=51022 RepID=A0A0C2G7Y5_9BILA|nr:PAN domain protein [Ancylostoma duodenale]
MLRLRAKDLLDMEFQRANRAPVSRSSLSLLHCKSYCLHSQTGVYSCRSFVYDNINQVCDLFAHVGDQAPARLLKFQSRDYFEPTHAYQCLK